MMVHSGVGHGWNGAMRPSKENAAVQLVMRRTLLARADGAAECEGLTRPEYIRRAIIAACERTEALQARRARTAAKGGAES